MIETRGEVVAFGGAHESGRRYVSAVAVRHADQDLDVARQIRPQRNDLLPEQSQLIELDGLQELDRA